ncbi:uncharacterized protein LOC122870583 [Siniperca chuatsi]|uniref:uncharacterized protein LOC122870583 n=1 Tax=Siniperca chuatsi TaxID=119488 RepID=UPI001CE09156|nr:uncharacterized protein LOC122870583 [Siniperca chuatsi]
MDSGIYKVSITDLNFKESTELHRHIVEETVPRPVIRMLVMPSNQSAGFCNIRVNCSIQDDWVWSVCDGASCSTSQGSLRKVNITISADNRSIVCTGNNHVSTSNISESIEAKCFNKSNPGHEETPQLPIVIMIVIAMCVSFCVFIFYMAKGLSTKNNHHQAQTSSAQLTQSQPVEAQPQLVPRVSTSSSGQSEASYENVDAAQPSQTSSPTISPREELGSKQSQKVDTVYSVLEVANVNASLGKSDGSKATKGHKKIQEALTSQSVTVDEAEHPTQIDTVYSMLQKPKNLKSQHHQ